eukprot:1024937-Karenia_brevis.AAC.1
MLEDKTFTDELLYFECSIGRWPPLPHQLSHDAPSSTHSWEKQAHANLGWLADVVCTVSLLGVRVGEASHPGPGSFQIASAN